MKPRFFLAAAAATLLMTACGSDDTTPSAAPAETAAPEAATLPPTSPATPKTVPTTTTAAPTTTTTVLSTTTTTFAAPPLSTTTTTTTLPAVFEYTIRPSTAGTVWATWREGCPVSYEELSLLTLTYWNFDGTVATGEMVINAAVAADVVAAFEGLFDIGFPIERIELVDNYGGDDKAAMAANVTSGFNCRFVDGTDRWSNHAFGLAVDINPLINPWARAGNVLPVEGEQYTDRTLGVPGMINLGDDAIRVFEEVGWSWGGVWRSADYMHFSKPGN